MSPQLTDLIFEIKEWIKLIPARISYLVLAVFLTTVVYSWLADFGSWKNASFTIPLFPWIIKFLTGSENSKLSTAFFKWWYEAIPIYVHWGIVDLFAYYFLAKAYWPEISAKLNNKSI